MKKNGNSTESDLESEFIFDLESEFIFDIDNIIYDAVYDLWFGDNSYENFIKELDLGILYVRDRIFNNDLFCTYRITNLKKWKFNKIKYGINL